MAETKMLANNESENVGAQPPPISKKRATLQLGCIDGELIFWGAVVLVGVALMVLLMVLAIKGENRERAEWAEFSKAHACRIVAQRQGHTTLATTVTTNGKVGVTPITTPGQTAFECNDGVTYWRNK